MLKIQTFLDIRPNSAATWVEVCAYMSQIFIDRHQGPQQTHPYAFWHSGLALQPPHHLIESIARWYQADSRASSSSV